MPRTKSRSKTGDELKQILEAMLKDAWDVRDRRQKKFLGNGLSLELYITDAGVFHLLIYRYGVKPSIAEWETIMDYWPWVLPEARPKPTEFEDGERYCLSAHWRRPLPNSWVANLPKQQAEAV